MKRLLRLTHFAAPGQQDKKPKNLDIILNEPIINDKGYVEEGNLLVIVDDGTNRVSFQLKPPEAAAVNARTGIGINMLGAMYVEMSDKAAEKSREAKKK